jgi:2-polyprenyl-3-methyl-5-hydroxy-6-metoxy-1,4-benzoquinol methylase
MSNKSEFVEQILSYIKEHDSLHYKKIRKTVNELTVKNETEYKHFCYLLYQYFSDTHKTVESVSANYLQMVNDMRYEGIYFKKNKKYSCKNQNEAYLKVYSNKEVMSYYMNALLLSQILWAHHFKMLMYFNNQLVMEYLKKTNSVLDIGPGHGFFSNIVIKNFPAIEKLDIVDISLESLEMTKKIIGSGEGRINYLQKDIFEHETEEKYDLIIFGEVLEHLDEPVTVLKKLIKYLSPNGYLWLTTPTNAPAIDHIYLFRSKDEIVELLIKSGLKVTNDFGCYAEDVPEEVAVKFDISYLYGAFCQRQTD